MALTTFKTIGFVAILQATIVGELQADGVEAAAPSSHFQVSVAHSADKKRIQIAVFNIDANNIRAITSYRQAEKLGDLIVSFDGDASTSSRLAKNYTPPSQLLAEWVPVGNGFGWSLPLDFFKVRYALEPGCYVMKVAYGNRAAVRLGVSGKKGPVSAPAHHHMRVCFN